MCVLSISHGVHMCTRRNIGTSVFVSQSSVMGDSSNACASANGVAEVSFPTGALDYTMSGASMGTSAKGCAASSASAETGRMPFAKKLPRPASIGVIAGHHTWGLWHGSMQRIISDRMHNPNEACTAWNIVSLAASA